MVTDMDFGLEQLERDWPAAYEALPEPYKNDSCLTFFVDNNGHLCAEKDTGEEYVWFDGQWVRGK
jgi:hypothetical protein